MCIIGLTHEHDNFKKGCNLDLNTHAYANAFVTEWCRYVSQCRTDVLPFRGVKLEMSGTGVLMNMMQTSMRTLQGSTPSPVVVLKMSSIISEISRRIASSGAGGEP